MSRARRSFGLDMVTSDPRVAGELPAAVRATLEDVEKGAYLVVNDDRRTWVVTEDGWEEIGAESDPREWKRTVRIQDGGGRADAAIIVEDYGDRVEGCLYIHDSPKRHEPDTVHALEGVEVVDTEAMWVLTGKNKDHYHLPDALSAARGWAEPACGVEVDCKWRFVRSSALQPIKDPCMSCFRERETGDAPIGVQRTTN